jgi:hypothetical protein
MNNFNQPNQRQQFSSPYFNPVQGVSTPTNNILWVNGIEGAKAWQLNPNSMAILLDSETEGKMYIKVSDNIGMSSLRIFNYTEEIPSKNTTINNDLDLSQFVRKDELSQLIKELLNNEQSVSTVASTNAANAIGTTTAGTAKVVTVKK